MGPCAYFIALPPLLILDIAVDPGHGAPQNVCFEHQQFIVNSLKRDLPGNRPRVTVSMSAKRVCGLSLRKTTNPVPTTKFPTASIVHVFVFGIMNLIRFSELEVHHACLR